MQGGGKDKLNTVTSNQPTVYMFLPMEVISSPQQIPVVQVDDLTMIPSAQQVRQAISNLYKNRKQCHISSVALNSHLVYWTMTGYRNYKSTTSRNLGESLRVKKESGLKGVDHFVVL